MCSTIIVRCSWDGLPREETVPVPGGSGAQSSVASTRRQQFKEGLCWMWGIQSDYVSPFFSLWISTDFGEWGGLYQWFTQQVRFGSWAEPDSYWWAEDGFNDGRVELFQQLLWQVELPQLAKEVQPLLGLFNNGVCMNVPLQVLRDGGA